MKSDDITIQQLFQDRRQYMVPFYQRAYVWTLSNQWDQLWEDIRAKADARLVGNKLTPHFLGAVVLDPQPRVGLIGVDTLHIIDGQQRLTTLQFILKSMLLHSLRRRPELLPFLAVALYWTGVYSLTSALRRYSYPLVAEECVLAAWALIALVSAWEGRRLRRQSQ